MYREIKVIIIIINHHVTLCLEINYSKKRFSHQELFNEELNRNNNLQDASNEENYMEMFLQIVVVYVV